MITIDEHGENSIIVAGGANMTLTLADVDLDLIRSAKMLVLQLEVPVADGARSSRSGARSRGDRRAQRRAGRTARPGLLDQVDLLVVNEHEARTIVADSPRGSRSATVDGLAAGLLAVVPAVVVTMGEHGALAARRGSEPLHQRAPSARVVDTTAAGDTFTGALAAALVRDEALADAVWFATCAASLAVEVAGAMPSIPHLDAIKERMREPELWPSRC